jgi:membrane protease YdiL (CAAX protease family)
MKASRVMASGKIAASMQDLAVPGATLAYGVLLQRVVPERWHVPLNAVVALSSLAVARRLGAGTVDCGLSKTTLGSGLRTGAVAAAVTAVGVAVASVPGRTRRLFAEERIAAHGRRRAVFEVMVRIPFGTTLSEEVIFRGSILGLLLRRHPRPVAVALTSALFGVWHVLPTLSSLQSAVLGRHAAGMAGSAVAVASVVGVTAAAGAGLAELRLRSGSVLAPALAHAALNASAYVVARRTGH